MQHKVVIVGRSSKSIFNHYLLEEMLKGEIKLHIIDGSEVFNNGRSKEFCRITGRKSRKKD